MLCRFEKLAFGNTERRGIDRHVKRMVHLQVPGKIFDVTSRGRWKSL